MNIYCIITLISERLNIGVRDARRLGKSVNEDCLGHERDSFVFQIVMKKDYLIT